MKFRTPFIFAVSLALMLITGLAANVPVLAGGDVRLTHVHGLAYSADGSRLLIPSHHGLAIFESGKWRKADGPAHDYMGFSATRDALYSSGHPAPGSGLSNPFGLIKSIDGGKSWQRLGLDGEADFHMVASGYASGVVYLVNHALNSRMNRPGIYYTRNDGLQWTHVAGNGLGGELRSLALHPTDVHVVAAGTANGLYLSRNAGQDFEPLVAGSQVLGAAFDLSGRSLWFGTYAGKAVLMRLALDVGAKPQSVPIPALMDDGIAYIAHNPTRRNEVAFATFKRNVFMSSDQGRNWKQIAREGVTHE